MGILSSNWGVNFYVVFVKGLLGEAHSLQFNLRIILGPSKAYFHGARKGPGDILFSSLFPTNGSIKS